MDSRFYKIALICNILGLLVITGYVAFYLFFNESTHYDIGSLLFYTSPIVIMVLDYIALTKHKWLGWSIASISIKAVFLLFYLAQSIFAVIVLLEYGYRYDYIVPFIAIFFSALILYPSIYSINNTNVARKEKESNKQTKQLDRISIAVFSIEFAITGYFLILGLSSIGAIGWGKLGVFLIPPSLLAITILLLDLFAIKDCKWFAWSVASLAVKSLCLMAIIPAIRYLLLLTLVSPYSFWLFVMAFTFIALIFYPSIRNIININKRKRGDSNG